MYPYAAAAWLGSAPAPITEQEALSQWHFWRDQWRQGGTKQIGNGPVEWTPPFAPFFVMEFGSKPWTLVLAGRFDDFASADRFAREQAASYGGNSYYVFNAAWIYEDRPMARYGGRR
jgi:hypothetical protein